MKLKKKSVLGREKCENFYVAGPQMYCRGHMETDPLTVVYHLPMQFVKRLYFMRLSVLDRHCFSQCAWCTVLAENVKIY